MQRNQNFDFTVSCSCGRSFSRDVWMLLPCDGVQSGYHDGKQMQVFEDMELRRCACGSTMAVPVRVVQQQRSRFKKNDKVA